MVQTQTSGAVELRSRTYAWADPHPWLAHAATLSGLEVLQRMAEVTIPPPPIAETLGMSSAEVEHGRFVVTITPAEFHYNPLGVVHGGVLAAVLDTAAGCAVHSTLPVGMGYTSLDLHTRFFVAVRVATGEVRCEGTVVHRGSRAASAMARIEDRRGRLLAQASSTCLLMPAGVRRMLQGVRTSLRRDRAVSGPPDDVDRAAQQGQGCLVAVRRHWYRSASL